MLTLVERFAREACGLRPEGGVVVVAVSGGPDSLSLLDVLHRLGYALVVAHYHHGLRPEADAEMAVVEAEARRRGLPFVAERGDVRAMAQAQKRSLEDAARRLRYAFVFRVAKEQGAQAVATGHTADDQAETLLLHLIRGAGAAGLRGMRPRSFTPWSATVPLVRPLLRVRRRDILAYARQRGLPVQHDPTNRDPAYTPRNRLRLEVLPRLAELNPRVVEALTRAAETLAAEDAWLEAQLDAWWHLYARAQGSAWQLDRAALLALPLALQRRALRRAAQGRADFAAVERALALLPRPGGPPHPWIGPLALWVEPDALWVAPRDDPPTGDGPQVDAEIPLAPGDEVTLGPGWRLTVGQPQPWKGASPPQEGSRSPWVAWLDAEVLSGPLKVAPPREGLCLAPLGMGGHTRKVSDLLSEAGVPWRLRARWPVVWAGATVVWLPGVRVGHPARLTPTTRQVIRLAVEKV
jgi:tRNA(Ile)-lysidine synthetase, N-terminal domain/tRNA(Ile)-lysidine synthetase, C-terminal domain